MLGLFVRGVDVRRSLLSFIRTHVLDGDRKRERERWIVAFVIHRWAT